ncbi:MAG: hypothetical protein HQM04_08090 [Magnetococcales bacterium]|nr:hypothetical protein [Magnetococcales bacterium]MBF0114990.1 hypothetical protein [Magnetococcales bacterium]
MESLQYLREILNPEIIKDVNTSLVTNTFITLKENNPDAKNKEICLYLPDYSIVFSLDQSKLPKKSLYLHPSNRLLHGGCDYVVFCYYKEMYWFIMIELKSFNPKGIKEQFFSSSAFIRYLRELIYLRDGLPLRYGLVSLEFSRSRTVQKQTTHNTLPHRTLFHDGAWYYKIINHKTFSLKSLLDQEHNKKSEDQGIDLFCFNRHSTFGQDLTVHATAQH